MVLLKIGIIIAYLHISALATTDIMRLLSNSTISVFDSKCYCSACNHKVALIHQFPIVSYILNRGKCPYCKASIDPMNFYLELISYILYVIMLFVFSFKPIGILFSFVLYEIVKVIVICIKGRKKTNFFREYFLSLLTNSIVFGMVGFLSILNNFIVTGNILK